ncbi:hypothetical protein PF003_g17996 [Phytophthora fragariae]|nr:hypothetical protein PF003_g17996 [Phytophthora fragariae]
MLSAPGGTATSADLGTSDRTRSSSAAHLEVPRRLSFSARATAQAVHAQCTWRHRDVCLSRHKYRTRSSSAAHLEAPRRLPFSARATAQAVHAQCTWTHRDVCLSRHKRPHTQFMLSAPGGTVTSAFLGTSDRTRSSSSAHLEAPRRLPFLAQVQAHKQFKRSAPGGTTTSAFLGTSDRTRSSSVAHLEAPRRLPFLAQVQAHKKFKHTAPGGTTTSAFLGPGLSSAHLEAP